MSETINMVDGPFDGETRESPGRPFDGFAEATRTGNGAIMVHSYLRVGESSVFRFRKSTPHVTHGSVPMSGQ